MLSPIALEQFSKTGSLSLSDTQISLDDISHLKEHFQSLRENPRDYGNNFRGYRITLSHIAVRLDVRLAVVRQAPEPVITGRVIEYPYRDGREGYTDTALGQMATHSRNTLLNELQESLVSLFLQPWSSIKLENVFFYEINQIDYFTSKNFYQRLLESLAENNDLKTLIVKPFSLIKHGTAIGNFLKKHTDLKWLRLQITEADRSTWEALCYRVSKHSTLKEFHLDTSTLDIFAYWELIKLLDSNYHIKLTVPEPTDHHLFKVFEPLAQRLSKSGFERFKEDRLSQVMLLQLAVNALENTQKYKLTEETEKQDLAEQQFAFLIANEDRLAITDSQMDDWIETTKVLPDIYQKHEDYLMQASGLVQLQMDAFVAKVNKTVGYVLLEKALATQNRPALEMLLNINVNLFEFPDGEEPFLVTVLQSKGDLRQMVVAYIKKDKRLVTLAEKYLDHYPDLKGLFGEFKDHLDNYGARLVKKETSSLLLSIAKKILNTWREIVKFESPSEKRGKECAEMHLNLHKSLKAFAKNPAEAPYDSFDEMHKTIIKMKEDSMKAIRGFFNSSFLHEESLELISKFECELLKIKNTVFHGAVEYKDNQIKELKENSNKKRIELESEVTDAQAENAHIKAEITREKAVNAQIKAENAKLRANQAQLEARILEFERQVQEQARPEPRGFRP